MTKNSPDNFSTRQGVTVTIAIHAVNFNLNVQPDPQLTVISNTQFDMVAELTMGNANTTFIINYQFDPNMPAGQKYTRTITSDDGFTDGPFDVGQQGSQTVLPLPYILKFAAPAAAPAVARAGQGLDTE